MALSKCINKSLQHFTEDASHNPVPLNAVFNPNFVLSTKLRDALSNALNAPRTDATLYADVQKLGINNFVQCNSDPYQLRIALVDMTGKLLTPDYAAFHDTEIIGPASIYKLAPIFAAHQLMFDFDAKARDAPAAVASDPAKKLKWTFDQLRQGWKAKGLPVALQPLLKGIIVVTDTGAFSFHQTFSAMMNAITHPNSVGDAAIGEMNAAAGHLITNLQWTYIGSILLQSGLCSEVTGGLWVARTKNFHDWTCSDDPKLPVRPVAGDHRFQQATAQSVAKYLTLVTQRKLISEQSSKDMKKVLIDGDLRWLKRGLKELGTNLAMLNQDLADNVGSVEVFGKVGAWEQYAGQALSIQRSSSVIPSSVGPLTYVVVCMTQQFKTGIDYRDMLHFLNRALIPILDGVIVKNNTTP